LTADFDGLLTCRCSANNGSAGNRHVTTGLTDIYAGGHQLTFLTTSPSFNPLEFKSRQPNRYSQRQAPTGRPRPNQTRYTAGVLTFIAEPTTALVVQAIDLTGANMTERAGLLVLLEPSIIRSSHLLFNRDRRNKSTKTEKTSS